MLNGSTFKIDVCLYDADGDFYTTVSSNWHKYENAVTYKEQLETMNPGLQFCIFKENQT